MHVALIREFPSWRGSAPHSLPAAVQPAWGLGWQRSRLGVPRMRWRGSCADACLVKDRRNLVTRATTANGATELVYQSAGDIQRELETLAAAVELQPAGSEVEAG
jgi:hypothetical protein